MLLLVGPGPAAPPQPAAVIPGQSGAPASAEDVARRYAEVFRRGYALVVFNNNDCAAEVLQVSSKTVMRDRIFSKTWLKREMRREGER